MKLFSTVSLALFTVWIEAAQSSQGSCARPDMILIEYAASTTGASPEIEQFYRAFGRDDFMEMNGGKAVAPALRGRSRNLATPLYNNCMNDGHGHSWCSIAHDGDGRLRNLQGGVSPETPDDAIEPQVPRPAFEETTTAALLEEIEITSESNTGPTGSQAAGTEASPEDEKRRKLLEVSPEMPDDAIEPQVPRPALEETTTAALLEEIEITSESNTGPTGSQAAGTEAGPEDQKRRKLLEVSPETPDEDINPQVPRPESETMAELFEVIEETSESNTGPTGSQAVGTEPGPEDEKRHRKLQAAVQGLGIPAQFEPDRYICESKENVGLVNAASASGLVFPEDAQPIHAQIIHCCFKTNLSPDDDE